MAAENLPSQGPRYAALIGLLRTAEALWAASRVFFDRWQLSPSQFNLLNLLREQPAGCSQSELSRQLITHRSNITGLVDRLENRGLVRRDQHAHDRRAFVVVLTPVGRALLAEILPLYHAAAEVVWSEFPAERAAQLVADLECVSANAARVAAAPPGGMTVKG